MRKFKKSDVCEIVSVLKADGVIAMPTDTIYGFSCLANEKAIAKLIQMKKCGNNKMFILLVSESYPLEKLVNLNNKMKDFIKQNTPNPVTMILPKSQNAFLPGQFNIDTRAIRMPKDDFLQSILNEVGFMISTSCNIHSAENLNDPQMIQKTFPQLDAIVENESPQDEIASTIVDLTFQQVKIIRQGSYIPKF